MRIFGSDKMESILKTLGLQEGEAITHPWMNKSLEMAQKKVEARNFDIRKQILKYDDVMNDQRKVIFEQRIDIMAEDDVSETVRDLRQKVIQDLVTRFIPGEGLRRAVGHQGPHRVDEGNLRSRSADRQMGRRGGHRRRRKSLERLNAEVEKAADERHAAHAALLGPGLLQQYENARGLNRLVDGKSDAEIGETIVNQQSQQIDGPPLSAADYANIGAQVRRQAQRSRKLTELVEKAGGTDPEKVGLIGVREREKQVLLETLDLLWREHLVTLEHLRQVIGFRAYGQRDPLNEYKTEAFVLFESMLARLRETVTGTLMHDRLATQEEEQLLREPELPEMEAHHIDASTGMDEFAMVDAAIAAGGKGRQREPEKRAPLQTRKSVGGIDPNQPATWGKVARNAPVPLRLRQEVQAMPREE